MNNRKNPLFPIEQEYLGIPIRDERSTIDEILNQDIYNQETTTDPNGTYRQIEVIVVDPATDIETGDNKAVITIPFDATLVSVHAFVDTASTSGVVEVSMVNQNNNDVAWLQIDANETGSELANNQPVIFSGYKYFNRYDRIEINIDAKGTGAKGLVVQLYFIVTKFYYS